MYRVIFSLIFLIFSAFPLETQNQTQNREVEKSGANYYTYSKTDDGTTRNCEKVRTSIRLTSKITSTYCKDPAPLSKANNREHPNNSEQYDTLTQSDIVRKQYSRLPYPAVSRDVLFRERWYYNNNVRSVMAYGENRTFPFQISFGISDSEC